MVLRDHNYRTSVANRVQAVAGCFGGNPLQSFEVRSEATMEDKRLRLLSYCVLGAQNALAKWTPAPWSVPVRGTEELLQTPMLAFLLTT